MRVHVWKEWFYRNRFLSGVLALASATAAGQLILVLATPLLTRIYAPDEFGILAVFLAVMSIVLVISSLRYELAIPLARSAQNARLLLTLALAINAIVAIISLLAVILFREDMARLNKMPALGEYLWLMPVVIFCGGSYKAFNYWAVRNNDYKSIARTKIVQSCANVGVQLVAGFSGLGALGLILGQLVGQAAGAARLAKGTGLYFCSLVAVFSSRKSRVLLRQYQRFPKYDVPASAINVVSTQLPNILLAALFSPEIAGLYMLAERVLSIPMSLLAQAVGQVLFGSSRNAIKSGKLNRLALKIVWGLSVIILFPALLVFFAAEDIFVWIFGDAWREAGLFASWMILGLSVQFVYSPISMLLMVTNGQNINLYIHAFMFCAKAGSVVFGYYLESPLIAILGFSMVGVVGYAGAVFITLMHAKRHEASVAV
ncbi:Polysaccharide biosynthesis protein [compost metagenome]